TVICSCWRWKFPYTDLFDPEMKNNKEKLRLNNFMVHSLVNGSIFGGRAWHEALKTIMKRIKAVLDPNNIMNPGKPPALVDPTIDNSLNISAANTGLLGIYFCFEISTKPTASIREPFFDFLNAELASNGSVVTDFVTGKYRRLLQLWLLLLLLPIVPPIREAQDRGSQHEHQPADVVLVDAEIEVAALRETVASQQTKIDELSAELEEERNAAATAASETMSMILRLQHEKAELQMERASSDASRRKRYPTTPARSPPLMTSSTREQEIGPLQRAAVSYDDGALYLEKNVTHPRATGLRPEFDQHIPRTNPSPQHHPRLSSRQFLFVPATTSCECRSQHTREYDDIDRVYTIDAIHGAETSARTTRD
ncbi:hypothetical protein HPP92_011804, partial [Vanilla planifolia]